MKSSCWTLLIVMALLAKSDGQEISLFNGKDLTGWAGRPEFWSVQDGAITAISTKENHPHGFTSLIWQGGEVSDFEFSCDFRILPGTTPGGQFGGIQFRGRVANKSDFSVAGYNVDLDYGTHNTGKLVWKMIARKTADGILRGQKAIVTDVDARQLNYEITGKLGSDAAFHDAVKRDGWNQCKIVAVGEHLQIFIDGVQTVDVIDQSAVVPKSGVLAFSLFYEPVATFQFKNLTLKKLTSDTVLAGQTQLGSAMGPRVYTDKNGKTFRATLVSLDGNAAKLKGDDGREVTVMVSDLCTADQAYFHKAAGQMASDAKPR